MIPIAAFVRIEFKPDSILSNPWIHDLAHDFIEARFRAERELGLPFK